MKMKDLKPGMAVAQRASSYNPDEEPYRLIVLSTEHFPGRRRDRVSEATPFVFSVTADDDGARFHVKARVFTPGGGDKASVLVLNTVNQQTEWLTPGQIEGPYVAVCDQRAETREAIKRNKAERDARHLAEVKRLEAVEQGLKSLGVNVSAKDKYGHSTDLVLSLEAAEALLERLVVEN